MRKALLLSFLLLAGLTAVAQNASRIRRDAAYLSAEGRAASLHAADSTALAGLAAKISAQAGLPEAVGATYVEDLRRISSRIVEGHYTVLRYLPADRINEVFLPRRERILQLTQQAEQTGDAQYWSLAYTLARSIPAYPADLLLTLQQRSTGSWTMQDFVSREADAVLSALEPKPAATKPAPAKKTATVRPQPETEHITVRDTVTVERDLGRIEIEHTFSRRDTLVVVPGAREGGTATVTLQRDVRRPSPLQGFVLAQAGIIPDLSYGLMLGLGAKNWGGYIQAGSSFRRVSPTYDCRSDGTTDFGLFWASGARKTSRISITAGGWFQCADWLKLYAGAGYGQRTVCWEDSERTWARVTDYSARGFALDYGVIFRFGHFGLSLGGETIAFRQSALKVGAGFCF